MAKRWTEEEEKFLKENYKKMSYQEIGLILGKKTTQIQNKKQFLGLHNKPVAKRFNIGEFEYIKNNYPKLSCKEIALNLNIKLRKVHYLVKILKINSKKTFFKHDYLSMTAISQILNISVTFIKSLIKCKFIRISIFKSSIRDTLHLIHIDEFENIKEFLNNYISIKEFAEKIFFCQQTVSNRIKDKKIKDFLKVGSKYFIHKNEIEIMRGL